MPDDTIDIEKLAKHDSEELEGDIIDINDQWDNVEVGDDVGIDPVEGGGIGVVTNLDDDEVTVEKEDGTVWTGDVNSVINTKSSDDTSGIEDELSFEPMSGFDDQVNKNFSHLIDDNN